MLCFPFSVAATNVALGLALGVGVLSGIWWQGVNGLWQRHRRLSQMIAAYLLLVIMGLAWSMDIAWGLKIISRHWFWMILPIVVSLLSDSKHRTILLASLSLGLILNLIYCILQIFEFVSVPTVGGSSPTNATGHIGHTSFGFIYGVWAAWLLHLGFTHQGKFRWLLWGLSSWAMVMIFMTEGKSGYFVTLAVVLAVAAKWLQEANNRRMFISFALVLTLLLLFLALGPGQGRLLGAWQVLTGNVQQEMSLDQQVAVSSAQARLEWWKMSYDIWLSQPIIGVGTGGFPKAVSDWQQGHGNASEVASPLVHPHNQYLLAMVRWGILGLSILLILLWQWIRTGLSVQWQNSEAMPLVALTGVALTVHGLSSASMEEHFSTIFALVVAGAGLSEIHDL